MFRWFFGWLLFLFSLFGFLLGSLRWTGASSPRVLRRCAIHWLSIRLGCNRVKSSCEASDIILHWS